MSLMSLIAWLGGAAFAGSLGCLAYLYAVTLAVPAGPDEPTVRNLAVNLMLFSLFAAHHSIFARPAAKRWMARAFPARAERSLYVWLASLLAVAMCVLWKPIPGVVYEARGGWRFAFWSLQALGLVVIARAASVIDPLELAGIRQASGSTDRGDLKVVGPFRLVRHPIYLGWMLLVFAAPLMTANRLCFAVISSSYLILAIPWEETSLAAAHGDRYREYQRMVRWRVLPGVW
jgi:protein-S-isoprenylcysteine O-methyltransferase Ste14